MSRNQRSNSGGSSSKSNVALKTKKLSKSSKPSNGSQLKGPRKTAPRRALVESDDDNVSRAQHSTSSMTSVELAQARKDSANEILTSILEIEAPSSTLKQYKTYLVLWKVMNTGI